MAEAQYAHNHTIDPETGYLENPAYSNQFDATKKKAFLELYYENGLKIRRTCDQMGISVDTVNRHYQLDPLFKAHYNEVKERYIDELEGTSRLNALNPRSVIERIFQLKSLVPEKYGDQKSHGNVQVSITIDGESLKLINKRQEVIDIEPVSRDILPVHNSVDKSNKL